MSEPVKKVGPAPASGAENDGKIGLEKTMLLNLQKMKESASGVMKAEDLEYPDVASLTSTAPQTSEAAETNNASVDLDDDLPEELLGDGPSKEMAESEIDDDLPDIDALALDDDVDIS